MGMTTISSKTLNQAVGKAKSAASSGPVLITHRGQISHVLLAIEEYQKITAKKVTPNNIMANKESIVDLLAMPEAAEIEFEPPR